MAQIAEDLFLLLLDNASAQPGLDRRRRERVLAAAVLLDLAYACRIRPAMADEPIAAGLLVALSGDWPPDPVADPAFELAVCACASIAARLVHEGYLVSVIDFDGTPLSDPVDGGDVAGIEQLAIDLAQVTARRDGSTEDLAALLGSPITDGATGTIGPLIVIGGRLSSADATAEIQQIEETLAPLMAAHHDAVQLDSALYWRIKTLHDSLDELDLTLP